MKKNRTRKVIRELFINDILIGMCFWSLIILVLIPFVKLPQSLEMVLYISFIVISLICFPFCLYKMKLALYLAKKGIEITATIISVEQGYFGKSIKFEYEYNGNKYNKSKYYHSIFFPEDDRLKLLVDNDNPSKFIILEFKKKSVLSIVRERTD